MFSDADYAADIRTRRSVSGIALLYVASVRSNQGCCMVKSPLKTVPILLVDNASAVKLANNPAFHRRSKHIDIRYHFVRKQVEEGRLKTRQIPGSEHVADVLTKPLSRVPHEKLRYMLGVTFLG